MTVHAFKRLLARVDPQVSVEIPVCSEGLVALVTLVRLLAGVNALVLLQAPRVEKSFPTNVTDKRLLPGMAPLVVTVRVFIVKGLPTDATVELLVLAVALFMKLEGIRSAKTLQTYFTAERFHDRLVSPPGLQRFGRALGLLGPVSVDILLMNQQPTVEEEGLPAQVAHEGLPGAVDEHVRLEFSVVREALSALLAAERLLSGVNANVPLEVVVQAKPRSAYVTGERLLPGVDQAVPLQSGAGAIRSVAHRANERRDARVLPLVHRQRMGVFESLLAHGAFVFFGVRVDHLMEAEGVFALEVLPARRAAERPFLRVHGHVNLELDGCLEGLVTMLALEHFLLLLVAQQVVFQRRFNSERFPTLVTRERLWRFQLLVTLQVVLKRLLLSIGPLTPWTGEGQGSFAGFVAQKMIFQRLLFGETFATLVAGKRLPVGFHVFLQFAFTVKHDAALFARQIFHYLTNFLLHVIRHSVFSTVGSSYAWMEEKQYFIFIRSLDLITMVNIFDRKYLFQFLHALSYSS